MREKERVAMHDVPALIPEIDGRRILLKTVEAWGKRGLRGVVLETEKVCDRRWTSREAVARFLEAVARAPRK